MERMGPSHFDASVYLNCLYPSCTDRNALLLDTSWLAHISSTHASNRRINPSLEFLLSGQEIFYYDCYYLLFFFLNMVLCSPHHMPHASSKTLFCLLMQHPYVYLVLIFEAMATFIGQVSVLSLIAIFGAATTAMVW